MIIGKTSIESADYDCPIFIVPQIRKITIPNYIKEIYPYSLACSLIESIKIPSKITIIGKKSFYNCVNLRKIEFSKDSKLQTIEEEAFFETSIKSITIPYEVTIIGKKAFANCTQLQQIIFSDNSKLQTIEEEAFNRSSIMSIRIPSKVIKLGENAFYMPLITEISENSKLSSIDEDIIQFHYKIVILIIPAYFFISDNKI